MTINDGILQTDERITSFLMIGQSNMAGRGEFADVEPIGNDGCFMLRMGRWQPMSEPVNPDRAICGTLFHSGISLAASFADELQKFTKAPIGLIPCADGGTSISQWMPGEVLFDHAVMMTNLAKRSSDFGGIIWHQGENDCSDFQPEAYKKNVISMMGELRKLLGAEKKPLLIGELSETTGKEHLWGKNTPEMNKVFYQIASELPCCDVVSSKGLTMKPDGIHFDAKSLREFGKRYFEKYIELAAK